MDVRIPHLDNLTNGMDCDTNMAARLAQIAFFVLSFFILVLACNFVHFLLRPLSQPRIIAELIVGVSLSKLPFIRNDIGYETKRVNLEYIVDTAMIIYMFVVGLEMDPQILSQTLRAPEAKVAHCGFVTTLVMSVSMSLLLRLDYPHTVNICLGIILSGTAYPLVTRIITDLKIGKSDIGRFVVSTGVHQELASILLMSIGFVIFDPNNNFDFRNKREIITMIVILVVELAIAKKVTPFVMNWVNRENPEGKSMTGEHLVLAVAYVVIVCSISPLFANYNKVLSAFLAGVFMPREGRIAKMMINKLNYFFSAVFFPLLFFWVGYELNFSQFQAGKFRTWKELFFLFLVSTVGKVLGSLVSGMMLGFHWQDSIAVGLLLNTKGHFHIYLAVTASIVQVISSSTNISMVFVIFLAIVYSPLVVQNIIQRARKRSPTQRMALQWLNPSDEISILLCLRGQQNLSSTINFMRISRGTADPGITVYLADMIELTDKIAATLKHGDMVDGLSVTDPEVVEMREQITNEVNHYLTEDGEGITMRRMIALSTLNNMHQDICILAEDLMVSLIILPFHKQREAGGRLNLGHSGFRHVNRKVLRHAPCSVGILVDRGLGSTIVSRSSISLHAAVIFIGGKDDREALAYAGRVARHPGVKLTVIRFLLEASGDSVSSKITIAKSNTAEHQEEMKADDECFAKFYDKYVAGGNVAYVEKYLVNSGQTFSTLRSLEGQYSLFIVGRGGRVNSMLTVGMNDWEECPELGPIGDILSASDFSVSASVLVIQQHSFKGELDGLQDEFSIM